MRAKAVTANEQYRLIMECRASGLTDYQWCIEHDIKPGTFYNWVKRLRQKGSVEIPHPAQSMKPAGQDIVEIHLEQPSTVMPESRMASDTSTGIFPLMSSYPVLELSMLGATIRIPHGTDPILLEQLIHILKGALC